MDFQMFEPQQEVKITVLPEEVTLTGTIRQTNSSHMAISFEPDQRAPILQGKSLLLVQAYAEYLYQIQTIVLKCNENCFVTLRMPAQQMQRRSSPRIACLLDGGISDVAEEGGFHPATLVRLPVTVVDMSLGGVRLLAAEKRAVGSSVQLEISISPKETLVSLAHLLRCDPISNEMREKHPRMAYDMGLEFHQMERAAQVTLQRILLKRLPQI